MTITILPASAEIGARITIKSCNNKPVDSAGIQSPDEVTACVAGEIINCFWAQVAEEKTSITYELMPLTYENVVEVLADALERDLERVLIEAQNNE